MPHVEHDPGIRARRLYRDLIGRWPTRLRAALSAGSFAAAPL
jgi:hypothetical protein